MDSELITVADVAGSTHRQLLPVPHLHPTPILEFDKNPFDISCFPNVGRWLKFNGDTGGAGSPVDHSARQWNMSVRLMGTPMMVPVIEIIKVNKRFGNMLKRNAVFRLSAAVTAAAIAAASVPGGLSTASVISPAPMSVITHVNPAILKKKKPTTAAAAPSADLCLHVARQLLELAQIKKEMCPVIAEEYTAGETAVMPCGHLFSKLAIQESFKKEANKCPACRQFGRPTYI